MNNILKKTRITYLGFQQTHPPLTHSIRYHMIFISHICIGKWSNTNMSLKYETRLVYLKKVTLLLHDFKAFYYNKIFIILPNIYFSTI